MNLKGKAPYIALFLGISFLVTSFAISSSIDAENRKKQNYQENSAKSQIQESSLSSSSQQSSATISSVAQSSTKPKFVVKKEIKIPVLMYHHIANLDGIPATNGTEIGLRVSPEVFEKNLQYIIGKGYQTITTQQLYDYSQGDFELPSKPIILTFDDGWKDNYTNALPLLKKYKQVGDFAIITAVVGTGQYMNWDEIRTLKKEGMGISSHTVNHCYLTINKNPKTGSNGPFADSPVNDKEGQTCPYFTFGGQLNTGEIRGELKNSKAELEKNLDIKISSIVYPYGKYNQQVMDITAKLGYSFGFTVEPQQNQDMNLKSPFNIPRIRMQGQQKGESLKFLD
jgi:peptidoglycan/xylan/chitin deacetylase (PgdA/CDA1 family)